MDQLDYGMQTTTTIIMVVRRKLVYPFHPVRGIQQGDPVSPYIFLICAEYLGKYIHLLSTQKSSRITINVSKDSLIIFYLMFVDDFFIFCRQQNR